MKKKLLPLPMLLVFVVSVLSVNMTMVSAIADFPAIMVVPESNTGGTGATFNVSIYTNYDFSNGNWPPEAWGFDIHIFQFTLYYNPNVLQGVAVTNGEIIVNGSGRDSAKFIPGDFDNTEGILSLTIGLFVDEGEYNAGPGTLANVTFTVVGEGASTITLGPETRLYGWDAFDLYPGDTYVIIDAATMPTHIQHGYFQNVGAVTHNIAVNSVTPSTTVAIPGVDPSVDITVVVENQGNINEAFDVTAYANASAIETKTVTNLGSGLTKSLTFSWDITGAVLGNYTISAAASTVPGEVNTGDNTKVDGTVEVREPIYDPVAIIITEETVAYANVTLVFDGFNSYDPDGGTIIDYFWDFGDGTNGTGQEVTHAYTMVGTYTVTLVVTDSQNQVSDPASLPIYIEEYPPEPPAYAADLVKWKAKPEAKNWDYSNDLATDDGFLTLTALTRNLGTNAVNVTITFQIIDVITKMPIGPLIVTDVTLEVTGLDEPVDALLDPLDYGYAGEKMRLQAQVTLKYDSDGDGTPDTDATQKTIRFTILP